MIDLSSIFYIAILILSVVAHEISHGYAALALGDKTAFYEGRLTLNPLKHFDLWWSFIIPLVTFLSSGLMFGMAKPVPYNPYNLRDKRWGELKVALAGPLSNFVIALCFGLILRFFAPMWNTFGVSVLLYLIVKVNVSLAIFNLIPLPPLDGSKILASFIPYRHRHVMNMMEQWSVFFLAILVLFAWGGFLRPIVFAVVDLIVG